MGEMLRLRLSDGFVHDIPILFHELERVVEGQQSEFVFHPVCWRGLWSVSRQGALGCRPEAVSLSVVGESLEAIVICCRGDDFRQEEFFARGFSFERQFHHLVVFLPGDEERPPVFTPSHPFAVPSRYSSIHEIDAPCRSDVSERVELDGKPEEAVLFQVVRHHGVEGVPEPCDAAVSPCWDILRESMLLMLHHLRGGRKGGGEN